MDEGFRKVSESLFYASYFSQTNFVSLQTFLKAKNYDR